MAIDDRAKRLAVAVAGLGDHGRVAFIHPSYFDGFGLKRLGHDRCCDNYLAF